MFKLISQLFDTRTELQKLAESRNLQLVGFKQSWIVLDTDCNILAESNNATDALSRALMGMKK